MLAWHEHLMHGANKLDTCACNGSLSLGDQMQSKSSAVYLDDLGNSTGIGFASCRLFILLQSDVGEAHEEDHHQQYAGNVSNNNGAFVPAWLACQTASTAVLCGVIPDAQ